MRRDEVLAILADHQDEIREMGVASLSLFGPIIHGYNISPEQEIDILLVVGKRPFGLLAFAGLKLYLEDILGQPVHLVTPNGIRQQEFREQVIREAVRAA